MKLKVCRVASATSLSRNDDDIERCSQYAGSALRSSRVPWQVHHALTIMHVMSMESMSENWQADQISVGASMQSERRLEEALATRPIEYLIICDCVSACIIIGTVQWQTPISSSSH